MSSSLDQQVIVFDPAGSNYHSYRIPVIVGRGDLLLAFCEGRIESTGDAGEIEIVLRRSFDAGRSWEPEQIIASAPGKTCGNPAPVFDPASGDVVLVSVQNGAEASEINVARGSDPESGRRVYLQRSTDDGATWSDLEEITDQAKEPNWGWYATGPCHGIALEQAPYAGRLVVPANHSFIPTDIAGIDNEAAIRLNGGHCIISDDGGHTWRIGFVDRNDGEDINANETAVTELADGRLYFNARNHRGTGPARVDAYSADGGESLEAPYAGIEEITAPGIQGSLLRIGDKRLLLSTPTHPTERRAMTIFVSENAGESWQPGLVLPEPRAGYSDLVALPEGRVGLLYEAGEDSSFANLRFLSFRPRHHLIRPAPPYPFDLMEIS